MTTAATHIDPPSRRKPRDILARLQLETAPEHSAIETATGVMHPELELPGYRAYLERTLGFYAPVEARLMTLGVWEELELDPAPRQKLGLIARDISRLGGDAAGVPVCDAPPDLASLAQGIGCAYVLEGSTLGGRVISRHVQARLGQDVPREFLECYGENTGRQWQAFRAGLSQFARSRELEDEVIEGAKKAFATFTRWLERA